MEFKTEMSKNIFASKYIVGEDKSPEDAVERIVGVTKKYYPGVESKLREAINRKWVGIAGGLWRSALNPNKNVSSINCTTLDQPDDSLESINEAWYWWAKFAAFGQGEGVDLSKLRPKGAKVHNSANKSTGAVSFMHTFDGVLKVIAQQGRRGASLISLNICHPDIPDFITVKDEEGVLESANISIHITDDFMQAVIDGADWEFSYENKYEKICSKTDARELFAFLAEHAWKSGDPGVQFIDVVRKYSNSDYLGHPVVSTNACCFTPQTLITTKEGLFPIKDLVGKEVTIFDGENWVPNNKFDVMGKNQEVYRVELSSGIYFDVTADHRFYLTDGSVKKAIDLEEGDQVDFNTEMGEVQGTRHELGAYLKGFLLGDGGVLRDTEPDLWVYEPKYGCLERLRKSYNEIPIDNTYHNTITEWQENHYASSEGKRVQVKGLSSRDRKNLYKWASVYKQNLPVEVFNWDDDSKYELIAGLFDADGTALDNANSFGYQLTSVNKDFLVDVLRLLSTIGVYGKISKGSSAGYKEIKGKSYFHKETWRITIPQNYAIALASIVSFQRLTSLANRSTSYKVKFKYNKVANVVKREGIEEKVYCTTVDTTHKFLINGGIITGNSEQWLDPHNVCLLSSINLAKFYEYGYEGYVELIHIMTKVLDAFRMYEIEEERSPSKLQLEKLQKLPRIGLGVTGLADFFIQQRILYASVESQKEVAKVFGLLAGESYKASYEIAKDRGYSFEWYDKDKYKQSPFVQRLLDEGLIEDYHLDYQAHVCKTTVAPNGTLTEVVEAGGGGVEPIFAKYFVRRERSTTDDWKEWFTFNHAVRNELESRGLEVTKENADALNEDYWVTAHDVNNFDKIELMSVIQKYIDSAISITYNLPESAKPDDIKDIYFRAWEKEIKAVSVFRDNSKMGVLITDANYESSKKKALVQEDGDRHTKKRPEYVECRIHEIKVSGDPYIVLVGFVAGEPYEVFVTKNDGSINLEKHKEGIIHKKKKNHYDLIIVNGSEKVIIDNISKHFDSEYGTLSRFISMSMRHDVPIEFIVDQLSKDKNFIGFEKSVSRVLKKYIPDDTKVQTSDVCPECKSELMYKEGCKTCPACGWSKCD